MKETLAMVLMLALCLSLAGCGGGERGISQAAPSQETALAPTERQEEEARVEDGTPFPTEKKTYTLMRATSSTNENIDQWPYLVELSERTNVYIEYINVPSSGWNEKKNLTFASGDFPDAMMDENILDTDVTKNTDVLVALNEYFDEYAPNINKAFELEPELKKVTTSPDGNIYSFGQVRRLVDTPQMLLMNQNWLDALDLQAPTTTDELYHVLKAFKEQDPNGNGVADEIPLTFMPNGTTTGWAPLFGSFGIIDYASPKTPLSQHVNVDGNKAFFVPTDERYKEAVTYFNKLYSEGLIDKEAFTQDGTQYSAKLRNENDIVGMAINWSKVGAMENAVDIMPLKGPGGEQMYTKNNAATYRRNIAVIFHTAQEPQYLIQWFDQFYTEEIGIQSYYGPYGIVLEKNDDGTRTYLPVPEGTTSEELKWNNCFADNSPACILPEWHKTLELSEDLRDKERNNSQLAQYQPKEIYPNVIYTLEELETMDVLLSDIDAYVERMQVKWIVEGGIDNEWADYLAQLEKLQLESLIEIYQNALDRYNAG